MACRPHTRIWLVERDPVGCAGGDGENLAIELIQATVQLEQPQNNGTRTVGTGFLISAPGPDGKPRTVLVTARHVFERMPGQNARIGYRIANADGSWRYSPQPLKIRDDAGHELWTHHPTRDVAAITIKAPKAFAQAAVPLRYLASDETFSAYQINTGDEMMALGFPRGLSANAAGFPILRSGRVASYPLSPPAVFPNSADIDPLCTLNSSTASTAGGMATSPT